MSQENVEIRVARSTRLASAATVTGRSNRPGTRPYGAASLGAAVPPERPGLGSSTDRSLS